jgi:hypothetical protein
VLVYESQLGCRLAHLNDVEGCDRALEARECHLADRIDLDVVSTSA